MRVVTLYRFARADGGVTVSPNPPEGEYTVLYRLIADEGRGITTDGAKIVPCADVESPEGWQDADIDSETEISAEIALAELMEVLNDDTQ